MRRLLVVGWLIAAGSAAAQNKDATVDPGMTKTQVIDRLGAPASQRLDGSLTFLYYPNGCEKTCGMQDLVILDRDSVVDAVFRAPYRHYTGQSSSPRAYTSQEAAKQNANSKGTVAVPSSHEGAGAAPSSRSTGAAPRGSTAGGADSTSPPNR
jgi:hypothetical protein